MAKRKLKKGNWSCFATPAEGLCMSSRNADFKEYGKIKNITDKDYYTNSNHIWVGKDISIYDKSHTEASYHAFANAGNIFYIETDGLVKDNPKAFTQILEELHNAECGYCAINHPVDYCSLCHYQGIIPENENCPKCGAGEEYIERIRRITGYLVGSLSRFNNGKKSEVCDRVKHH